MVMKEIPRTTKEGGRTFGSNAGFWRTEIAEPSPPNHKHAGCTDRAYSSLTFLAEAMGNIKAALARRAPAADQLGLIRPPSGSMGGRNKSLVGTASKAASKEQLTRE